MTYTFKMKTADGDDAGSLTTSEANWQAGDIVIAQGNTHWRVIAVVPGERIGEFVDGREVDGIFEVEQIQDVIRRAARLEASYPVVEQVEKEGQWNP